MLEFLYYTIIAILVLSGFTAYILLKRKRVTENIKRRIRLQWGKKPEDSYKTGELKAIASYCDSTRDESAAQHIDDITWNDLDMDDIFKRINNTQTSAGEEYLYCILRSPVFDGEVLAERDRLVEYFRQNLAEREKLQMILAALGKRRYAAVYEFFPDKPGDLPRTGRYGLLAAALLLSPLALFLNITIGFILISVIGLANMLVYYRVKSDREPLLDRITYIIELIKCARRISKAGISGIKEYSGVLADSSGHFGSLAINSFYQLFYNTNDMLLEPLKAVFLVDMVAFKRLMKVLGKHREHIRNLYENVGLLDSITAIASYRDSLDFYTVPSLEKSGGTRPAYLQFADAYHPLIKNPVVNSLDIGKPVLITGSNASGKSTFLKMTAINAIFAQTIHTCLAREYYSSYFTVFTSMALRDDVASGRSYYITEINSLKRIIDNINGQYPLLGMIDEVLRGTNTVERIAASSVILGGLGESNCIIVAATHDIELAAILKDRYDNYHFLERFEGNSILFEYRIRHGKATTRNAIKLLSIMGYPEQIVCNAADMADNFMREGKWNYGGVQ